MYKVVALIIATLGSDNPKTGYLPCLDVAITASRRIS